MTSQKRADDTIIKIHAMHITRMQAIADRRKTIALFEDTYGGAATAKLKQEIERIWPQRKGGTNK